MSSMFQDRVLLMATRIFSPPFFRDSLETPPFDIHLRTTGVELPHLAGPGYYPVRAHTLAGKLDLGVRVLHWGGEETPCVIHHQGGGERPFDRIISSAYPQDESCPWTVIAVKAAMQDSLSQQNAAFASLDNYLAMIAASVTLTERLVHTERLSRSAVKLVSGYSLGGFVAMRHHLCFNTADLYVPFVAGGRHTSIFTDTVRSGIRTAEEESYVRERLDMDREWETRGHPNVFPVLARRDGLNRIETMLPSFGTTPVEIWEKGHLQGATNPSLVRRKIDRHILEYLKGNS